MCRCPSQIQVLMVGHLEIAGRRRSKTRGRTDPETVLGPQSSRSIPSFIVPAFTLGGGGEGQRPGDAPTPRLPNHCPVKGPELNYLGTPSSRLSRRDNVESLQRDCPDIISHAS